MAYNNFKITGASVYISKSGNDSLAGTANEPKKSLYIFPASTIVIGAGEYDAANIGNTNVFDLKADGLVKIKSSTGSIVAISGNNGLYEGILFEKVSIGTVSTTLGPTTLNCTFKECTGLGTTTTGSRLRINTGCVFINCSSIGGGPGQLKYNNCIFINTLVTLTATLPSGGLALGSSYLDPDSIVNFNALDPVHFRNNNVQGLVRLPVSGGTKDYAIKDQLVGTPQDNGYPIGVNWLTEAQLTADSYTGNGGIATGWDAAVATCMNRDPKFQDASAENFILQADSPHIKTGSGGSNIGGLGHLATVAAAGVQIKNEDDGIGGVRVLAQPEIDSTILTAYQLDTGQTQGYVDYVFPVGRKILLLTVNALYAFNSDSAGGSLTNNNAPDSQPLTAEYPNLTQTTGAPGTLNELIVPAGLVVIGNHIRVNGQPRSITNVVNSGANDTLTLSSNLIAAVGAGVNVTYGTESQIAALNPNRLTVLMRTRTSSVAPSVPLVDSEWDNEVDPSYGVVGEFFQQEINKKPGLIISGLNIWGGGDSDAPTGIAAQELAPSWANVRVYLRNNYSSRGI